MEDHFRSNGFYGELTPRDDDQSHRHRGSAEAIVDFGFESGHGKALLPIKKHH